jgi:hypothetical protein
MNTTVNILLNRINLINDLLLLKVRKKDDPNDILFNFQDVDGLSISQQLNTIIPQGPEYNSFNIQIIVKVIDDSDGMTEYIIPTPVVISPNTTMIQNSKILSEIINIYTLSDTNKRLYEGDLLTVSQLINSISAYINSECNDDKNSLRNSSLNLIQVF